MKKEFIEKWIHENTITEKTSLFEVILNVSDICNRKCSFCPHGQTYKTTYEYPYMSTDTALKVCQQLTPYYNGYISFSDFGEPTLNPNLEDIIKIVQTNCPNCNVMIITNGYDIKKLYHIDNVEIIISDYGQIDYDGLSKLKSYVHIKKTNLNTFNNRAGNTTRFNDEVLPRKRCCNFPFYKMNVDINGDVILCSSDWLRTNVMGNIYDDNIYNIWNNDKYKKIRYNLINCNRKDCSLCKLCDIDGIKAGQEFVNFWKSYYGC